MSVKKQSPVTTGDFVYKVVANKKARLTAGPGYGFLLFFI